MNVYWAYTKDGVQFDGCCATDEEMARLTIIDKYAHPRRAREASMLDGMSIVKMDDVRVEDQWRIEQLSLEEYLSPSSVTLARLITAIDAMTERRAAIRDRERQREAEAAIRAGDIDG